MNNPEIQNGNLKALHRLGRVDHFHRSTFAKSTSWPFLRDFLLLVSLLLVTIAVTYFSSGIIDTIWYLLLLVLYSLSKNEALWLAFFLVTVDGFIGFFGIYSTTLVVLPGLPGVELAQFYVLIALFKAIRSGGRSYIFYNRYIQVIALLIVFLVVWGQVCGFSGGLNAYFRVLKLVFPFTLFYSIPYLFKTSNSYEKLFWLIFLLMIIAFITQLVSLLTGFEPANSVLPDGELFSEPGSYRGFFNAAVTLMAFYGALFYLSLNKQRVYNKFILYAVFASALGMAVISATRGWILGFGIVTVIQLSVLAASGKREIPWLAAFLLLFSIIGLSSPQIKEQVLFSRERIMTLSNLAEGDISAKRTLYRLDVRSPAVLNVWKERPLFGWGFSDTFWKYGDGHVGNQNILLLSGLTGFLSIFGFLIYFTVKLLQRFIQSRKIRRTNPAFLVFPVFLLGWFIIHSTSGQQFGLSGMPLHIIPQAVFFSFGAFVYHRTNTIQNVKKI